MSANIRNKARTTTWERMVPTDVSGRAGEDLGFSQDGNQIQKETTLTQNKTSERGTKLPDPQFTPDAAAHHAHQGHSAPKWVSHMSMVVFTLKCVCTTMITDGFQPQTCAGAWCGMS